jgi:glycosyltransferase involved in cell wall biosynthesis
MNPIISVIVPVYNGEKYLKKCIDSLIVQSINEIEIIIVNDGSNDNSSHIAHVFAEKDNRIVVIDKENEGVSVARNTAIKKARGKWIAFSDADDYYYPDGLAQLYSIAEENHCNIVLGNSDRIAKDGVITQRYSTKRLGLINNTFPTGSLEMWGDLFHHSLFKSDEFLFAEGLAYLEDRLLMLKLLSKEGRYAFCSEPVYAHIKNSDSVLESKNGLRMARHCFWAARLMEDYANRTEDIYFKEDIFRDSENAKCRALIYFLAKKNASLLELRDVYLEFFAKKTDFYVYYLKIRFQGFKALLKYHIKKILK